MSIRTSRSSIVTGRIRTVGAAGSLLVVNLGPLQPTAEVDVDRLPFRVRVEGGVAGLAMAVAGLLPTAEREVDLGARRAGVDVHDARLEVAHRPERGVRVAGDDRGREAVARLVDRRDRALVVVDRHDREDRPEDLLLGDPVHRLDGAEDPRLEEVAVAKVAVARPAAAGDQLAFPAADVDVARDLL